MYEAECMLGDVGHVRRMSGAEVVEMTMKEERQNTKKQWQCVNSKSQKDVVALSRELVAVHSNSGKRAKKRRLAQRLAKMNEMAMRRGSHGLREAVDREVGSTEEDIQD